MFNEEKYKIVLDAYLKSKSPSPLYYTELTVSDFSRIKDNCIF